MKRCVIATDRLRLSAGPTHKTTILLVLVLPVSSESRHTDGRGGELKSTQKKTSTANARAAVGE